MTRKEQNEHFLQYEKLILKQAHYYANKYQLEFETVQGQALEIYCEALQKFDSEKSAFSTYLYNELRRLNYFCKIENAMKIRHIHFEDINVPERIQVSDHYDFILWESVQTELSNIAQDIIQGILSGELLAIESNKKLFSIDRIMDNFGVTFYTAQNIYQELSSWWAKFQVQANWEYSAF